MFIKWILPPLLLLALVGGLFTGFTVDNHKLQPGYENAGVNLKSEQAQAEQLNQPLTGLGEAYQRMDASLLHSAEQLTGIKSVLVALEENVKQENALDAAQKSAIDKIVSDSKEQAKITGDVLDSVLSKILGKPMGQTYSDRTTIKVYSLKEAGLRGYMAKVKLHDPTALKLVLSGDKVGHAGETTSAAAKRKNAVLAINAGGFARDGKLLYPMGITVVDGSIKTFYRTDLSFIGINKQGHLVGGDITTREQVQKMGIQQGATFVPTLLKSSKKQAIPAKWKNKKEPRTIIGHFSNGDLLFIVIDGRQKESSGITLEEAQKKLLEWNVRDAYTLDGGGSSTFVYNGKVLNSPSDGVQRKVVSNFVVLP